MGQLVGCCRPLDGNRDSQGRWFKQPLKSAAKRLSGNSLNVVFVCLCDSLDRAASRTKVHVRETAE